MPNHFKEFNANMRGVDLFDQFLSSYCVRIFAWSINGSKQFIRESPYVLGLNYGVFLLVR